MKTSLLLAVATVGVALFTAGAAMAHGDHHSCEEGKYGWHRHAGKYADHRVACERPRMHRRHREPVCYKKCNWFGPFKKCKTVCE